MFNWYNCKKLKKQFRRFSSHVFYFFFSFSAIIPIKQLRDFIQKLTHFCIFNNFFKIFIKYPGIFSKISISNHIEEIFYTEIMETLLAKSKKVKQKSKNGVEKYGVQCCFICIHLIYWRRIAFIVMEVKIKKLSKFGEIGLTHH